MPSTEPDDDLPPWLGERLRDLVRPGPPCPDTDPTDPHARNRHEQESHPHQNCRR